MLGVARVRKFFYDLATGEAAKQIIGIAAYAAAGPAAGMLTYVKPPIERFLNTMADRFWTWMTGKKPAEAVQTLEETANLSHRDARKIADEIILEVAPAATAQDREVAANLIAGLCISLRQSLPRDAAGKSTCPVAMLPKNRNAVFGLLPSVVPPFIAPCTLPNSPYELEEMIGMGGFGAVYRARVPGELVPRAIKICLDPTQLDSLKNERKRLEQIEARGEMRSKGTSGKTGEWNEAFVRLYGHHLDEEPYFLVYEYMPDGDLVKYTQSFEADYQRKMTPDEVLRWIRHLAEKVAIAHRAGIVHRDLKPTNILRKGSGFKLGDFGLGTSLDASGLTMARRNSSRDLTQMFRGGGTPLYMSPEQERGTDHYSNDIYSLGVIWYQMLMLDFSQRPPHGWEDLLRELAVPEPHLKLLGKCIRPHQFRPADGDSLVEAIDDMLTEADAKHQQRLAREQQAERERIAKAEAERERVRKEKEAVQERERQAEEARRAEERQRRAERDREEELRRELQNKRFMVVFVYCMGWSLFFTAVGGTAGGLAGHFGWNGKYVVGASCLMTLVLFGGLIYQIANGSFYRDDEEEEEGDDDAKMTVGGCLLSILGILFLKFVVESYIVEPLNLKGWSQDEGILFGGMIGGFVGLLFGVVWGIARAVTFKIVNGKVTNDD